MGFVQKGLADTLDYGPHGSDPNKKLCETKIEP